MSFSVIEAGMHILKQLFSQKEFYLRTPGGGGGGGGN